MVTLSDLSLSAIDLDTLPRLKRMRERHFNSKPAICTELPRSITDFLKQDHTDSPELRAGNLYQYVLEHKTALIAEDNLLAGTTTTKPVGVVLYPDLYPLSLWPELETMARRQKNPFDITKAQIKELNELVFPYWMDRNIMEVTRANLKKDHQDEAMTAMLRLVYFMASKPECISHTIPNYAVVVERGLGALIAEARQRETATTDQEQKDFYQALQLSLQGIITYAHNLGREADRLARRTNDPRRQAELLKMGEICRRVPEHRPDTFQEGVQAIWICKIALHQENANLALSLGRLDQILYPLYARDIVNGTLTVEQAVELVGCLWLSIADHVPMIPESGEELFGGSGSNQAVTLGGVDQDGNDAVNDLTYVMLKATELLVLRDPNVNARYHPGDAGGPPVNPPEYLKRLCEVNLVTKATPCFHNDPAVIDTLVSQNVTLEHARDYGVIGCVEPFSAGRTYGHSGAILMNLTSALERTLFGGKHRLTGDEQLGLQTTPGRQINSFPQFQQNLKAQLSWLIDQAVIFNNASGRAHQAVHRTPMLSALMEGCMEKGKDVICGGATYNFSGAAMIGLADVVDSLNALQEFVFSAHPRATMPQMIEAIEQNWEPPHDGLHLWITTSTEKFGRDGSQMAKDNAHWLMEFLHDTFQRKEHYRGGKYTVGYWTMTNHAGFGLLTKALPSGRKDKEAFASGITPVSGSAPQLTSCLNYIAALEHRKITNGQALNIKFYPDAAVPPATRIQEHSQYIRGLFNQGGIQVQFNIIDRNRLKDVVRNPQNPEYKDLLVRVSGYTAYFKDLNPQMQKEIITRAEYDLATGQEKFYNDAAFLQELAQAQQSANPGLDLDDLIDWLPPILQPVGGSFLRSLEDEATETFLETLLWFMEKKFALGPFDIFDPDFRKNIEGFTGTYRFYNRTNGVNVLVWFRDDEMHHNEDPGPEANVTVTFKNSSCLRNFLLAFKKDIIKSVLNNEVTVEGNLNYLYKFGFMANHILLGCTGKLPQ